MTDADFLKAMHIKAEVVSNCKRESEPAITTNSLIHLDEDDLRATAVNWINQAREQYQENQVLRASVRRWRTACEFTLIVAGILLIALIAVCGGQL